MPRYILDLRHVDEPEVWFARPRPFRDHGSLARRCDQVSTVAAEQYDGLIWIDPTTPSVLLPFD